MSPDGSLNSGAEDSGSEAGSWSHDEELDDKEQSGGVFGNKRKHENHKKRNTKKENKFFCFCFVLFFFFK